MTRPISERRKRGMEAVAKIRAMLDMPAAGPDGDDRAALAAEAVDLRCLAAAIGWTAERGSPVDYFQAAFIERGQLQADDRTRALLRDAMEAT